MIVRALRKTDIDRLKEIHYAYFKHEFDFPNFLHKFLCGYVVENNKGAIISGGGVRLIPEVIIMTDKSFSPKERREALLQILETSMFVSGREGFEQMHAFVKEENWKNILTEKYQFRPCEGQALVREI